MERQYDNLKEVAEKYKAHYTSKKEQLATVTQELGQVTEHAHCAERKYTEVDVEVSALKVQLKESEASHRHLREQPVTLGNK